MKRLYVSVLAIALVGMVMVGCAPTSPRTTPVTPPGPATSTPEPTSTTGGEPSTPVTPVAPVANTVPITVYFTYHEKMQAVQRYAPAGTTAVLKASITALLAGPDDVESAAGLSTQIPEGTKLLGVSISNKVAKIDLSSEYDSGGGSLSMFNRIAQVVFTATQFKSVSSVQIYMNGAKVKMLGGEGVIVDRPQTRKDWEDQAPAILVESPAWGGTVTDGMKISGSANVFEGTLQMQIKDSSGHTIQMVTVQATSGTGTRGTWSAVAKLGNTKSTKGTVRVFDYSAKDGKQENIVSIPVVFKR